MINFQLADIDKVLPAGGEDGHHVSWFWLTDGMYWLTIGDQTIYEHSEELIASWGEEATKYCDYYIVRFLEDFTSIFGKIRESVPLKFYGLVDNLIQFRENTQKWAEVIDEDGDEVDEDFVDKHEMLISWYLDRRVSAGHLVGGPKLVFVRHNDKIKIHIETEHVLENGMAKWSATNGVYEMDYLNFVAEVKDFGDRFFEAMDKQVELAIAKDWNDVKIDKERLVEEHAERKSEFYANYKLLTQSYWTEVEELYDQMINEIE
jgi:hypothetical protein